MKKADGSADPQDKREVKRKVRKKLGRQSRSDSYTHNLRLEPNGRGEKNYQDRRESLQCGPSWPRDGPKGLQHALNGLQAPCQETSYTRNVVDTGDHVQELNIEKVSYTKTIAYKNTSIARLSQHGADREVSQQVADARGYS